MKFSYMITLVYICTLQHIANLAGNKNLVLRVPAFIVINGGCHAENKLAMQVKLKSEIGYKFSMTFSVEILINRNVYRNL